MQRLKEDIRQLIIQSAKDEFLSKNFRQASMRDISKKAGISVSNVYNYYKNKAQLFSGIVSPGANGWIELRKKMVEHAKNQPTCDKGFDIEPQGKIDHFVREIMRLITEYHEELVILFDKSKGTKFEGMREQMYKFTAEHFISHVAPQKGLRVLREDNSYFVIHVIANNLIEAIVEVCRYYKGPKWAKKTIEMYFVYHVAGMMNLLKSAKGSR